MPIKHQKVAIKRSPEGPPQFCILHFDFCIFFNAVRSTVYAVRKIHPFLTNKANFQKVKFNVTNEKKKVYAKMDTWWNRKKQSQTNPNKANSKPISLETNPILHQNEPKQTQLKPISNAKLQLCKLELIMRIWCYKSTIALTFAPNSLILLNGDVKYSMLIASGIANFEYFKPFVLKMELNNGKQTSYTTQVHA